MTLREKIQNAHSNKISDYSKIYTPTAEVIEKIADDYAIEILERYHNSLFYIPLKDGEAKEILKHLKNETNTLTKN